MPCDEQLTLLIVRLELFPVEQTNITKNKNLMKSIHPSQVKTPTAQSTFIIITV